MRPYGATAYSAYRTRHRSQKILIPRALTCFVLFLTSFGLGHQLLLRCRSHFCTGRNDLRSLSSVTADKEHFHRSAVSVGFTTNCKGDIG